MEEAGDVATVLETHNKQPEDSLQQNRYIYLRCVIMTPHTASPVGDLVREALCKPSDRKALAVGATMPSQRQHKLRLSSPRARALRATEPASSPAGSCSHQQDTSPRAPAGNAARDLTAHRDQRRTGPVSPNQLLKPYTGDCG